jgi:NitT/TauT family transport system permease protein
MKLGRILPPLAVLVAVGALAELLSRTGVVAPFLMPPPTAVVATVWTDGGELLAAFLDTALAALLGLALAFAFGTLGAVVLAVSPLARRAFYPYAVFFQTVPVIAIAPILVIWFGYGLPTVVASAFLVAIFPVIANTFLGLRSTDQGLVDLFRLYGASRAARLWRLTIPFATPQIFAGLRIAAGLAVIGAVVGEFIAGGGLGGIVDVARTQQRIDKVYAAVLLSSLLGLLMVGALNALAHIFLKSWHASQRLDD